jgi:hypothetical protein
VQCRSQLLGCTRDSEFSGTAVTFETKFETRELGIYIHDVQTTHCIQEEYSITVDMRVTIRRIKSRCNKYCLIRIHHLLPPLSLVSHIVWRIRGNPTRRERRDASRTGCPCEPRGICLELRHWYDAIAYTVECACPSSMVVLGYTIRPRSVRQRRAQSLIFRMIACNA